MLPQRPFTFPYKGGRETSLVLGKLEPGNSRSLGPTNSQGIPNRVYRHSLPRQSPKGNPLLTGTFETSNKRGGRLTGQRCHQGGDTPQQWLYQQHFPGREKEQRNEASNKFKKFKRMCGLPPLQNGGHLPLKGHPKKRGLVNKTRPQGCLPDYPHMAPSPEISPLHLGKQDVGIFKPPVRPIFSTLVLHQSTQTHSSMAQSKRSKVNYIPRRHVDHGPVAEYCIPTHSVGYRNIRKTRIRGKSKKNPT